MRWLRRTSKPFSTEFTESFVAEISRGSALENDETRRTNDERTTKSEASTMCGERALRYLGFRLLSTFVILECEMAVTDAAEGFVSEDECAVVQIATSGNPAILQSARLRRGASRCCELVSSYVGVGCECCPCTGTAAAKGRTNEPFPIWQQPSVSHYDDAIRAKHRPCAVFRAVEHRGEADDDWWFARVPAGSVPGGAENAGKCGCVFFRTRGAAVAVLAAVFSVWSSRLLDCRDRVADSSPDLDEPLLAR